MREWLNSQAAAGYVVYHATSATYELTPEQSLVLAEDDSPVFMPPAWEVPASMFLDEEKVDRCLSHRQWRRLGRAQSASFLRRRGFLSKRLPEQFGSRVAAGAPRRGGKTARRRQSCRCGLRSWSFHDPHGRSVSAVALLGLRLSRANRSKAPATWRAIRRPQIVLASKWPAP